MYSKRSIRCFQPDKTNPRPAQVKITKPNASKYQKLTVSDTKAFFGFRLSMKHGVIKRKYELYFEKKCGFLLIRLVISAITRHGRSSGFWRCCYGNSGAIGLSTALLSSKSSFHLNKECVSSNVRIA